MKPCPRCNHEVQEDQTACPECGVVFAKWYAAHPATGDCPQSHRQINWTRIFAAVLTSPLFFVVSCTSGMVASTLLTGDEDYGPAITASLPPSKLTVVIASVPDAGTEGARKSVIAFLSSLDKFKVENPNYSFLLPLGKGKIENLDAEMVTDYQVIPSGPGTIIVTYHFHHDVPPVNMDVRARYEATDKDIKLLNAKAGSDFGGALIMGFFFATILAVSGRLLKKRKKMVDTIE